MNGIAIGLGILILMAGVAMGFSQTPMTTSCTASPYKSVVFTGQVTDSTTGVGLQGAVIVWSDPPNSNNQVGGQTASGGYYYILGSPIIPFRGCDTLQVLVQKGNTYRIITQTFQLPDNSCNPVNSSCNSVTIGANYAMVPLVTLIAAFTYSANSLTVTFTDKSTGGPNEWYWQFGDGQTLDGTTASAQNPVHTYSSGGTYSVILTAYQTGQAKSTATTTITVTYGGSAQGTTPPPSCPTGYTGTYPNCVPPPSNQGTTNTQNNTTNKTVNQPKNLSAYNVTPLQMLVIFVGGFLIAVGIAWNSGRKR